MIKRLWEAIQAVFLIALAVILSPMLDKESDTTPPAGWWDK